VCVAQRAVRTEGQERVRRGGESHRLADADEIDEQRRRGEIERQISACQLAAVAGERADDADRPLEIVAAMEAERLAPRLVEHAPDADPGRGAAALEILHPVDGETRG